MTMRSQSELALSWTLVDTPTAYEAMLASLTDGSGRFAIDTERASGFRYGQAAYLVQVARQGSGTFLVDPVAFDDLHALSEILATEAWIIHAASQDLPCLRDLQLTPPAVVDTELGARLLGLPRVGLGALVEHYLHIKLEKAHSAVDWSTRPLPQSWLEYAAFDAAVLPELWAAVEADLREAGKLEAATQEFEHERTKPPKPAPAEPWRKLSGVHSLKGARELNIARELWTARDTLAQQRDVAPGRLIPDRSIVFAAKAQPRSASDLARMKEFQGRESRKELDRWWQAIRRGKLSRTLPSEPSRDRDSLPHPRYWTTRRPDAAARLTAARPALESRAEALNVPLENLLTPEVLRRAAWDPIEPPSSEAVSSRLRELGARPWQVEATAETLATAFSSAE